MDSRRRRANDFTNSLHSFRQTFNEDHTQSLSTYSEDSLDTDSIRNRKHRNDKQNSKNSESHGGSIILAGNLVSERFVPSSDLCQTTEESCNIACSNKQPLLKDILNISDDTSYMSLKDDLNKCINLFHNEHLRKKSNAREKYSSISSILSEIKDNENDPHHLNKNKILEAQCNLSSIRQYAASTSDLLKPVPKEKIRKSKSLITFNNNSKRDTNQDIKADKSFLKPTEAITKINKEKVEDIIPLFDVLSLSDSSISLKKRDSSHFITEDQKYSSISSESTKEELNPAELRILLHTLADQPKFKLADQSKEATNQKHLLRRLSITFYDSPREFTERLLTIIEESVVNNDSNVSLQFPEVSLCRLTAELRKMCKFIENETAPEWPPSPGISTPIRTREENQETISGPSRKSRGVSSPSKSLKSNVPTASRCNIKSPERIHRHVSKNVLGTKSPMYDGNTHDSTSVFESLEAYCNRLYPDEYRTSAQKNHLQLQSPSQNMNRILCTCKNQMASLENSPTVRERFKNTVTSAMSDTADEPGAVSKTPNFRYRLLAHDKTRIKSTSPKQRTVRSKRYEMIEPDDLENTLMYEIAKKRQRCLDTAKMMIEIDGNSDLTGLQQTCSNISEASSTSSDGKLMETLMSCKRYQDYLEEHKPLLNLLRRIESNRSRSPRGKKTVHAKQANKADNKRLGIPKFSATGKRSKSPSPSRYNFTSNKVVVSKAKLFVTPGKTPSKAACKEKRTYFPNLAIDPSKCKGSNASPHMKSIYRQMGLNYDTVISPVGMYIRGTDPYLVKNLRPKTDEMLLTPRKKQTKPSASPKPQMRFKLSPKRPIETLAAAGDENVPDKFSHPKVNYKLPSHVRTIKEANRKVGNRVNELLRSTQDKVVIRHEGRTKTIQTDSSEQPEIHYDSAEESVHIEQTARKTCFSRLQKDF